jgi:hypothetical protein
MLIPRGGGRGTILLGLMGLMGLWGRLGLWGPGIAAFPDPARGDAAREPRAAHWPGLSIALRGGLSSIPRIGFRRRWTAEVSAHA